MSEKLKQIFRYRGNDLVAGGEAIDDQVYEWFTSHPNYRVVSLNDERRLDITSSLNCECIINVTMEYEEVKE
jgi:hypothetical protein